MQDHKIIDLQYHFDGYRDMPVLWKGKLLGLQQFEENLYVDSITDWPQIKSNKRLGKLAEDLFSIWLKNNDRYESIIENIQIIKNKQTIGELDVLLLDNSSNRYIHLELITKFYVYNPAFMANDIRAWVGPNRNDSLYDKVTKLKEKQLPLLHNEYTQEIIAPYLSKKKTDIEQQVLFKANLFVPLNFKKTLEPFNTDCIVGNYLTFFQFEAQHNSGNQYFCPTKQDWLRNPNTQKKWNKVHEVLPFINQFMEIDQSLMVWVKYKQDYKRYIIVPYEYF